MKEPTKTYVGLAVFFDRLADDGWPEDAGWWPIMGSTECVRGLPVVFDTARRPWILPTAASSDAIAVVVAKCPSGALHYTRRDGGAAETPDKQTTIVPRPDGPLYVRGCVQVRSADGKVIIEDMRLALCRCGQSHNKPLCDNSHRGSGFKDSGVVADRGMGAETETNDVLSITPSENGPLLLEANEERTKRVTLIPRVRTLSPSETLTFSAAC